jgi:hypothetical protein
LQANTDERVELVELAPIDPTTHQNDRPLIILAQACHNCPGKYVFPMNKVLYLLSAD